jgi:predicted HTH domain antitoxin
MSLGVKSAVLERPEKEPQEDDSAHFSGSPQIHPGSAERRAETLCRRAENFRDTISRRHEWQRKEAVRLREQGAVPRTIAELLDVSLESAHDILREQGVKLPAYLDQTVYPNEIPVL